MNPLVTLPDFLPSLTNTLDQNPAVSYLATLRASGRRSAKQSLSVIAQMVIPGSDALAFPWGQLRYQHTAAIRTRLAEKYKPSTAKKHLSALKRVLEEAWRLGLMDAETYHRARDIKPVRGESLPKGRALSSAETQKLLKVCTSDLSFAGVRDAALLGVMIRTGVRRSEVVALNVCDYDPETGELKIIAGKGNKDRIVYTTGKAKALLEKWLAADYHGSAICATHSPNCPIFIPINRHNQIQCRRMTDQAVFLILQKRVELAGITNVSPHDLRRTFITDTLEAGADISIVQRLAGHSQVTTTTRYDRRGEKAKKSAAAMVDLPLD